MLHIKMHRGSSFNRRDVIGVAKATYGIHSVVGPNMTLKACPNKKRCELDTKVFYGLMALKLKIHVVPDLLSLVFEIIGKKKKI